MLTRLEACSGFFAPTARRLVIGTAVFAILLVVLRGCDEYGEAGAQTYAAAVALHSICNRQDQARLELLASSVAQSKSDGVIPEHEAAWLEGIIRTARTGDWAAATLKARQLLSAQVVEE